MDIDMRTPKVAEARPSREQDQEMDGLATAILASRFDGIVRTMTNTLLRSARSGVVNTARDFSCCIVTAGDDLLSVADSLPIHVLGGPGLMAQSMKLHHPDFENGDAYLHNSPYEGNTHAADFSILVPVMDEAGVHRFTIVTKAHQADCGNAMRTTYVPNAVDVYDEGALIFPCVKVQEEYEDNRDIIRMCRARIRVPEQWWGDHLALVGSARVGQRQLIELGNEIGWDRLEQFAQEWLDYSEGRMRTAIGDLAAGEITVGTAHDPIPGVEGGVALKVKITTQPQAGSVRIDLRDNPDALACGLNLTEATANAAALIGVFNSLGHSVPANGGSMRCVEILLRENCVVGIPVHPTSCSVATTNVMDRVANAVQWGIAELSPGKGMAECGLGMPPSVGVASGRDPRADGNPFINQLVFAWGGGAAGPSADGWLTAGGVGDGGVVFRDSVEIDELLHPIRIDVQRIQIDSEGAGEFRGAPGMYAEFGPIDCDMGLAYISDGAVRPASGAVGGLAGGLAEQHLIDADGTVTGLPPVADLVLSAGERVVSISCGGGGYGSPFRRDAVLVLEDVSEGWISSERARDVYGVVVSEDGTLDLDATAELRERRSSDA